MGWKDPIGKRIKYEKEIKVIGVVKDFHYHALGHQVEPLILRNVQEDFNSLQPSLWSGHVTNLVADISGEEVSRSLNYIREVFEKFDSKHPFEYYFLDDGIARLYSGQNRLMKLTGTFSGICILISCLGLFGLAAFTTEQRTKEIGVRKVLGASTFQIIAMLSRSILIIVFAASTIASLIAWLAIDEWLSEFAYHAGINPLVFVLSAAIALAVAFGTVALQSFKTANENPVKALRYE
jgi:putative ABC transport system permease protein